MLGKFFEDDKVIVDNRAQNGRSTRTFISENRWQAIVNQLNKGDYVFIQFGHNDESKEKADRYTPPDDYRNNLIRFVAEVRAKEAIPVLLTPVMRRRFDEDGHLQDTHGEYPNLVRGVATQYHGCLDKSRERMNVTTCLIGFMCSRRTRGADAHGKQF